MLSHSKFTITFTEFEEVRSLIWHLIHAHSKKGFVVIAMMYMLGGVQNHKKWTILARKVVRTGVSYTVHYSKRS